MGYHDVELPEKIAYGSEFGFSWKNAIHVLDSGSEQRVQRRSIFRKEANLATALKDPTDLSEIKHFAAARRGAVHSFPVKDWSDYTTGTNDVEAPTATDMIIGTGDGSQDKFQLSKRYGDLTYGVTWNIRKPVSGKVLVAVDGNTKTEGSHYNVAYDTGIVTFTAGNIPTGGQVITAGCEFRVPMRFSEDVDQLFLVKLSEFNVGEVPDIGLLEDVDPSPISDEYDYGGGGEREIPSGVGGLNGRMTVVTDATGSLQLPAVGAFPLGGPYACILNQDAVNYLAVIDENSDPVGTIDPSTAATLWLMPSGGGKAWLLV